MLNVKRGAQSTDPAVGPPSLPRRKISAQLVQAESETVTASPSALPPPALPRSQRTPTTSHSSPSPGSEPAAKVDLAYIPLAPTRKLPPVPSSDDKPSPGAQRWVQLQEFWLRSAIRKDSAEDAALRYDLEEEEVLRYLTNFQKHASYFRIDQPLPASPRKVIAKPDLADHRIPRHATHVGISPAGDGLVVGSVSDSANAGGVTEPVILLESDVDADASALVRVDGPGPPVAIQPIAVMPGDFPAEGPVPISEQHSTDWFGYLYAAYLPDIPQSAPPEPFTIARMRSSSERLYVAARPPWESFGLMLGEVILREDWRRSARWMTIYALLVVTSKFVPFLISIPLYHLIKARFFPPSPYYLLAQAQHTKRRLEEAQAISEDVIQTPLSDPASTDGSTSGRSGIKINLGEAAAKMGMGEAASRIEAELEATVKPAKENRRIWKAWKAFETAHGTGLVVVTDDVADMHEKVANLFAWKRPAASAHAILVLSAAVAGSSFVSSIVMLKLAQIGLGVLLFVVIPIVARKERYDPIAWLLGGAPTDAEYVTDLLRKRQANGEGIPDIHKIKREKAKHARAQSVSDATTLASGESVSGDEVSIVADGSKKRLSGGVDWAGIGDTSVRWLDGGRSLLKGEVGVKLGWKEGDAAGLAGAPGGPTRELKLGAGAYGITIASKNAGNSDLLAGSTAFLAVHKGKSGTMAISSGGIHFATFLPVPKPKQLKPSKASAKAVKGAPLDAQASLELIAKEQAEAGEKAALAAANAIDPSGIVEIRMEELVGIKKSAKSSLMVVITSGIEVEIQGGKILSFPFVANRDQAFNLLLALSPQSFRKV